MVCPNESGIDVTNPVFVEKDDSPCSYTGQRELEKHIISSDPITCECDSVGAH